MSLFVCDECETVENTALGFFWCKGELFFADESKNNKYLCSACTPKEYADGSVDENAGEWHGRWERFKATEETILGEGLSNFRYLGRFDYLKLRHSKVDSEHI